MNASMKICLSVIVFIVCYVNLYSVEVADTTVFSINSKDVYKTTSDIEWALRYWNNTSKVKKFYHNGKVVQGVSNYFVTGTIEIKNPIIIKKYHSYAYYMTSDSIYQKYNGDIKKISNDPNCFFYLNPMSAYNNPLAEMSLSDELNLLEYTEIDTDIILKKDVEYIGKFHQQPDFILLLMVRGDILMRLINGFMEKQKVHIKDKNAYYPCVVPCMKKISVP